VGTYRDDLVVIGVLGGSAHLLLEESEAPLGPPTSGGLLYVEDGHLHYLSSENIDTELDA
jgi:hypothetical protein